MTSLVFVDCEADGPCPATGRLTEFGAVLFPPERGDYFHGVLVPPAQYIGRGDGGTLRMADQTEAEVFAAFGNWITSCVRGQPVFVSDNPAFDWQWINDGFHRMLGRNPFGHSARRISDFYAGLRGDFRRTQEWKRLRVTPHDHNPVHDARGNAEAFARLLAGER